MDAMTDLPPRPNRPVYLDNQATTRCDPRVLAKMLPYFTEEYGNPHSAEHVMGHIAETAVEDARAEIAALKKEAGRCTTAAVAKFCKGSLFVFVFVYLYVYFLY